MTNFIERHRDKIQGALSCWDRVIIQGTLPGFCYAQGMTSYLYAHNIRIFDYPKFAEPLRDLIRSNAETVAQKEGLDIEFIRRIDGFRKEDRIQAILKTRGHHPGLVHIFSAMEGCTSYKPWHDKTTGKTFLKPDSGKCLHYYFYFIDPVLGLCYLRVPTWCPFRLQFYFNGHNWLATKLTKAGISFDQTDNAFTRLSDFESAQKIANDFSVKELHRILDRYAQLYCPAIKPLASSYHWSVMQVEYATDILFKTHEALRSLYDSISRTAIHAVKVEQVATFLGRKLHGRYAGEAGNQFHTRLEGTCIKHRMGPASVKLYDKFGLILRIETTTNDLSFFQHHRTVEHRNGTCHFKLAPLKKSIYSLQPDLKELLAASNHRYLNFLADIEDPTVAINTVAKIAEPVVDNNHSYPGYNFFRTNDQLLFQTLLRVEYCISGFRNKHLSGHLHKTTAQISHALKRLRLHGIIKRVGHSYKYYLTDLGRRILLTGLKIREFHVLPSLLPVPV